MHKKFLEPPKKTKKLFQKFGVSFINAKMNEREISIFQARVALQYLSDKVNQQADQVKIKEENLATCQR